MASPQPNPSTALVKEKPAGVQISSLNSEQHTQESLPNTKEFTPAQERV